MLITWCITCRLHNVLHAHYMHITWNFIISMFITQKLHGQFWLNYMHDCISNYMQLCMILHDELHVLYKTFAKESPPRRQAGDSAAATPGGRGAPPGPSRGERERRARPGTWPRKDPAIICIRFSILCTVNPLQPIDSSKSTYIVMLARIVKGITPL